ASAWNGFILSLSLMRKEQDTQTLLARFALQQPQLPYDKQLTTIAFMLLRSSHPALAGWVRSMAGRAGGGAKEQQALAEMAADVEAAYRKLVEEQGEEQLKRQGMLTLEEMAARPIELELILREGPDTFFQQAEAWLGDERTALTAIRMLCLLPDPRSER